MLLTLLAFSLLAQAQSTEISRNVAVDFSVTESGFVARESLKGTTKTQGDFRAADQFDLRLDGVAVGGVHTIEGLEHEHETIEYLDSDTGVIHFRPGRQKPGKITITREFSGDDWFTAVNSDGKVARKSLSVVIHGGDNQEAGRINLGGCLPLRAVRARASSVQLIELECLDVTTRFPNSDFIPVPPPIDQ